MKELYISPELELLCLAPAERLAANEEIDYDDLTGGTGTGGNGGSGVGVEIDIPL